MMMRLLIVICCVWFVSSCDIPEPNVVVTDVRSFQGEFGPSLIIHMKNKADVTAHGIEARVTLTLEGEVVDMNGFFEPKLEPGEILIKELPFAVIDHESYDRYHINLVWFNYRDERFSKQY